MQIEEMKWNTRAFTAQPKKPHLLENDGKK